METSNSLWRLGSDMCNVCNEKENYEHIFITCKMNKGYFVYIKKTAEQSRIQKQYL